MKKKVDLVMVLSSIVCLVPILISSLFYNRLPERVATHWDFNGVANGYSSKAYGAFGLPVLMLVVHLILCFALENDPKKANTPKAIKTICKWIIPIISICIQITIIANAIGNHFNLYKYIMVLIGILFIAIGYYLPKCKQNYTIGIKLPWTLDNENNWIKTHKLAGVLWIAGGIAMMLSSFFIARWFLIIIFLTMILVPICYSFYLYKKD